METEPRPVMTAEQVAEMLCVKPNTVRNLHRVGVLRGVVIGHTLRFLRAAVDAYIAKLAEEASR